jgi:hypothetical protein
MADSDLVHSLQNQLHKYESAIAEFTAVDSQLKLNPLTARVADMIRINRETINSMERSAELVRQRIKLAEEARRRSESAFAQRVS